VHRQAVSRTQVPPEAWLTQTSCSQKRRIERSDFVFLYCVTKMRSQEPQEVDRDSIGDGLCRCGGEYQPLNKAEHARCQGSQHARMSTNALSLVVCTLTPNRAW
jgi:hypothetical protein